MKMQISLLLGVLGTAMFSGCASDPRPGIELTVVQDEGQEAYRIATSTATWIFHLEGAGFSSLLDPEGNDWINYRPEGGASGHYRGIPNAVFNIVASRDNFFHPGHKDTRGSASRIISSDDNRVVIHSESANGRWAGEWEILPDRAHFRMTRLPMGGDEAYWFLYEGTPGGRFSQEDLCLRSDGTLAPISERWEGTMEKITWVAFISRQTGRSLVLVAHDPVNQPVSYWPMNEAMTVFGFGRALGPPVPHLQSPAAFTVALIPESDPGRVMKVAERMKTRPLSGLSSQ